MNAVIILGKDGRVPGVGVPGYGRILRERSGQADLEIRKCALSNRATESENAVIVQQGLLDVLVQRKLAAKLEGVTAAVVAEGIARRVEIGAGHRARNRLGQVEEPGHGDLRKGWRTLQGE